MLSFLTPSHHCARVTVEIHRSDKQGTAATLDGIALSNRSNTNITFASVLRSLV